MARKAMTRIYIRVGLPRLCDKVYPLGRALPASVIKPASYGPIARTKVDCMGRPIFKQGWYFHSQHAQRAQIPLEVSVGQEAQIVGFIDVIEKIGGAACLGQAFETGQRCPFQITFDEGKALFFRWESRKHARNLPLIH